MDLRDIDWGAVEWIRLAQDRNRWRAVVNAVLNPRVLAPRSLLVSYGVLLVLRVRGSVRILLTIVLL
jgi:hypothetical protein